MAEGEKQAGAGANREVFARNLRHYVELKGLSRQEICAQLGVSYTTFADWYNGRKFPRIDALEKLAGYFGVTKTALIEEEPAVSFDEFTYAFLDETKELTEENKRRLLDMARFFREQQEKEEQAAEKPGNTRGRA